MRVFPFSTGYGGGGRRSQTCPPKEQFSQRICARSVDVIFQVAVVSVVSPVLQILRKTAALVLQSLKETFEVVRLVQAAM